MNTTLCTRRSLLKIGAAGLASMALPERPFALADEPVFKLSEAHSTGINRFPRMVQEYYVARLREIEAASTAKRMGLSTKADAQAYVHEVQDKIQRCFSPWPEKTPLHARITGRFDRDTYRVENVIFESRPGFLVTANLYLPTNRSHPLPAVIGTCGHTKNGKAGYQDFAQGLARLGYVVLIYDPIGQGERFQYLNDDLSTRINPGTAEHNHEGGQMTLVGESLSAWRAWDGIRALDYLLTRKEVDPKHVGVTGNSGGGTMTTWLCGVEQRWSMAAASCFVSSFRRNLENEEAQDSEQCPPRALAFGLDHLDFLAASAPDPIIILAKEKDFFDVRGAEEAYAQLQHIYGLLGVKEKIGFFAGEGHHGYTQDNREAMYRWFNTHTGGSRETAEPEIAKEEDTTLHCAPDGQVFRLGSKTVFEFTREKSQLLTQTRASFAGTAALRKTVKEVLRLPDVPSTPPEFRVLKTISGSGYPQKHNTRYAVETEAGMQAIVYRLSDEPLPARPPRDNTSAILYVSHISTDYEFKREPFVRELIKAQPDAVLYAVDVRGIGESRPDVARANSFLSIYGGDYMHAAHGIMLDEPYAGRKTLDVLRTIDFLVAHGHTSIHLAGRGWGATLAALAAIFASSVTQVTLKDAPASYAEIAETELYEWPLSYMPFGVLNHFDLPDCYAALSDKEFRMM